LLGEQGAGSRRYSSAVLRPLTGYEEEWLAHHRREASAISASRILDACIVDLDGDDPPRNAASRMLVGDRDYLMLQLRRLMLGNRILAVTDCPACRSRMDVDFDAASIPLESGASDSAHYEVELPGAADQAPCSVRFRLPCGEDQEAVLDLDADDASEAVLERCLLSDVMMPLSADQRARVIAEMEGLAPRIELELDLTCPECRHDFLLPFDTTAFFLDELRISAGQLLREVHCLAFYYHWSESEILALDRDRRRAYLALLTDALRQE